MPTKANRRKARVFRRTAKGTRMAFKEEKHAKQTCGMCAKVLHGVPHGAGKASLVKKSKTQRRPSAPFAGILCSSCREHIIIETARVKSGMKKMSDVAISSRKFVEQAQGMVN